MSQYVIVGTGPAGVIAAETLRSYDKTAGISLIGDEPHPPYSRMAIPYLLEGKIDTQGTYLRKEPNYFDELGIELVHARVDQLDTGSRQAKLGNGQVHQYDKLLIATGSRATSPPIKGLDLPKVSACWTLADAQKIATGTTKDSRVVLIGAGFIGCIIMQSLVARGVDLHIIEMGEQMLPRMMNPQAGAMIKQHVESKGVKVSLNTQVQKLEAAADKSMHVYLNSGQQISADYVIVAAGITPNVDFLQGSGVEVNNGVLVDKRMQTSNPSIFAAGDVTEAPALLVAEQRLINPIQPSAADQAQVAAMNMLGQESLSPGALPINILDTLGLISSSFGQWQGTTSSRNAELMDIRNKRHISLHISDNRLIGATTTGVYQELGALRGLVQGRVLLGNWEERLLSNPLAFPEAYLARQQYQTLLKA